MKLFPAGLLGHGFIKDLHGPIPWVEAMPSVDGGSALTKKLKDGGYGAVTASAKEFADKLTSIRA